MPQSLTRLPETAQFVIGNCQVTIRDHRIVDSKGLFGKILWMARNKECDANTLCQFEKHGISYEAAIECCAHEMENDTSILADTILLGYIILKYEKILTGNTVERIRAFSKSMAGRSIANRYVDTLRNCDNWEQLYDELQPTSRFQKEMKSTVNREVKQQKCRKA